MHLLINIIGYGLDQFMNDEFGNTLELGSNSVQYYWALPIMVQQTVGSRTKNRILRYIVIVR